MSTIELWKDREKRVVDPLLFSREAEKLAKKLGNQDKKNKQNQLRRFFDEVVRLHDNVKNNKVDMELILPGLHMLIAKAVYAQGRNLVTRDFVTFIRDGIGQVKTKDDLRMFASFFESLMAYYKLYGPN